jgi:hypothetical protein
LEQNFAAPEFECPHVEHKRRSVDPHCSQKLLPSGTFASQFGHCIATAFFERLARRLRKGQQITLVGLAYALGRRGPCDPKAVHLR